MNKKIKSLAISLFSLPLLINFFPFNTNQSIAQQIQSPRLEEKIIYLEDFYKTNSLIPLINQRMNTEEFANFYIQINKKELNFKLFQKYNEKDILLLETPVALGRKGHSTPTGEFYISRVVSEPFWYPTKSSKARVPSKLGKNNPYGLWMSELFRKNELVGYSFPVPGDTAIRIHSTNDPSSIGKFASTGCIRLPPPLAEELFPALLHYIPHKEPIKNARGIIYPLEKTIPVQIE